MSAIDRRMIVVETGSSTAKAGSPKAPPTAPLSVASILCIPFEGAVPRSLFIVEIATRNAVRSAEFVVSLIRRETAAGSLLTPYSIGTPRMSVI